MWGGGTVQLQFLLHRRQVTVFIPAPQTATPPPASTSLLQGLAPANKLLHEEWRLLGCYAVWLL
jgi:hypothetical protein